MTPDTGQLATAVFEGNDGDFSGRWTMLGELNRTIDKLDGSALDTEDDKEYLPGDRGEPGEIEAECWFDAAAALPEPGDIYTATVTYPMSPDQVSPGSWTASGFFTSVGRPSAQLNNLMKVKVKFALNGRGTKFTYTSAVND